MKTKFGSYFLTKENNLSVIRRYVVLEDGRRSSKRVPKSVFWNCTTDESFKLLVEKLNSKKNPTKSKFSKNKVVSPELLEEFRLQLKLEIPTQKDSDSHFRNLNRYFLDFFIKKLELDLPMDWKLKETLWGASLLGEKGSILIFEDNKTRSVKTIKGIVQIANRFMAFLHQRKPKVVPAIKFTPVSKARLKLHHANLNLNKEEIGKFITPDHWDDIESNLPSDIAPFIKLGYYYGLRRRESLAVTQNEIGTKFLAIKKQLNTVGKSGPEFVPLKNRNSRKVPYWFLNASETYKLVQECKDKRIHPDTLSYKFIEYMDSMNLPYRLHDLRRTFITRALDKNKGNALPVMQAVGHSNTDITMKYLRDNRELEFELYSPGKLDGSN